MFDESYVFEVLTRGVRQALNVPGTLVVIEFPKLNASVEITLDQEDRKDPVFLGAAVGLMANDLRKYTEGLKPRFGTTIKPLASIRIRGEEENNS